MPHDERQLSQTYEYRRYELPPEFPVLLAADACRCAAPHGGLQPRGGRAAGSPGGGAQALGVKPAGAAQASSAQASATQASAAARGPQSRGPKPLGSPRLHFHNCLLVGKCLAGSGHLHVSGRRIAFREGDAMCVPRFVPHAVSDAGAEPSRWSCILVDMAQLLASVVRKPQSFELSQRAGDACGYVLPVADYPGVHQLISQISACLAGSDPASNVEILQGLFIALFNSLAGGRAPKRRASAPGEPEPPGNVVIAPALEFISDHYMQKLTVRQLAGLCLMSETHFRRTFLQLMGAPPLSFLNVTRIERACAMLATTKDSILSISEEVGFSSVSSFNRCFSNIKGATPREYRNKNARVRQAGGAGAQ